MSEMIVIDTNILVFFFGGNKRAAGLLEEKKYFLSAISYVEILSDLKARPENRELVKEFISGSTIIHTTPQICDMAAKFRLSYAIKIPDAIIAATAKYLDMPLVTADSAFFKIKEIKVIPFAK